MDLGPDLAEFPSARSGRVVTSEKPAAEKWQDTQHNFFVPNNRIFCYNTDMKVDTTKQVALGMILSCGH